MKKLIVLLLVIAAGAYQFTRDVSAGIQKHISERHAVLAEI